MIKFPHDATIHRLYWMKCGRNSYSCNTSIAKANFHMMPQHGTTAVLNYKSALVKIGPAAKLSAKFTHDAVTHCLCWITMCIRNNWSCSKIRSKFSHDAATLEHKLNEEAQQEQLVPEYTFSKFPHVATPQLCWITERIKTLSRASKLWKKTYDTATHQLCRMTKSNRSNWSRS